MATAVHKKQSESKYVSCFADSRPDVDITFRDVLLSRPTDHYLVGVDNFSMTNTSLSMVEPQSGHYEALIRIVMNPSTARFTPSPQVPATADDLDLYFQNHGAQLETAAGIYVNDYGYDLSIKSGEMILSMQQLMHRLGELAADVNRYMNTGYAISGNFRFGGYTSVVNEDTEHLKFTVATDGRISARGTRAFWSCFSIEVPSVRNQYGFYGPKIHDGPNPDVLVPYTHLRRFLTVHPESGDVSYTHILVNRFAKPTPVKLDTETAAQFTQRKIDVQAYNSRTLQGSNPSVAVTASAALVGNQNLFNIHPNAAGAPPGSTAHNLHEIKFGASVFSSFERRIAVEVGCSLPIKNSPMIDHQRESPDFVLARWIWRTDPRIECNEYGGSRRYQSNMPACTEYQGAQDRISYHELQAQSKIQTLRIKLFVRLRTFDELKETWGMRVIELPTSPTDWWHTRLHFMSAD